MFHGRREHRSTLQPRAHSLLRTGGHVPRYWRPFTLGFLTFAIAHAIEARWWHEWFGGAYDPWFLNSGRAAAFTLAAVVLASAVATSRSKPRIVQGAVVAAGAFASMAIMLFVKQAGPG